jgi:hypothetical protein
MQSFNDNGELTDLGESRLSALTEAMKPVVLRWADEGCSVPEVMFLDEQDDR